MTVFSNEIYLLFEWHAHRMNTSFSPQLETFDFIVSFKSPTKGRKSAMINQLRVTKNKNLDDFIVFLYPDKFHQCLIFFHQPKH